MNHSVGAKQKQAFDDYAERLTHLRDDAATGPDQISGQVWQNAPYWLKMKLYDTFMERWRDAVWVKHDVSTWREFSLHGIPKQSEQTSFRDYRWLGLLDELNKWYGAVDYAPIERRLRPMPSANSYGYKLGSSVDDCFGVLYEAVSYASKWRDSSLLLGSQDLLTAFDRVEHGDAMQELWDAGATAHQVLALARDYTGLQVKLTVPGVAETEPLTMTKGLRTGGKYEPSVFVRMLDEVMNYLEQEWNLMGLGFHLKNQDVRLTHVVWVDNVFLLAADACQFDFMIRTFSMMLCDKYGWEWKPTSLEFLAIKTAAPLETMELKLPHDTLKYKRRPVLEALGGVLDPSDVTGALMRHRFGKAEGSFYTHFKNFKGKAPVSLELKAYAAVPRAVALFLSPLIYWSKSALLAAIRWERAILRQALKLRRKPDEGNCAYNQRTAGRIQHWLTVCKVKPIHVAILERYFTHAWHERDVGSVAGTVRRDRDQAWWGAVCAMPQHERVEAGLLHSRSGPQVHYDTVFVKVWGLHWRQRLDTATDRDAWMMQKRAFVAEACTALSLPAPSEGYLPGVEAQLSGVGAKYEGNDVANIALPVALSRDGLWRQDLDTLQVEFIVDNKGLADLANLRSKVTNSFYHYPIRRIRRNLRSIFAKGFHYKAGYLDPVDWRAREFNGAADLVADYVIQQRSNIDAIDLGDLLDCFRNQCGLQFFCDGGYNGEIGAAAMVVVITKWGDAGWSREILGYRGLYLQKAVSSFPG